MIERDHDDVSHHVGILDRAHDRLLNAGIGKREVLDFDRDANLAPREIQHLADGWNPFAREAWLLPAARIQALQLRHRLIANQPAAVGGAIEQMVMNYWKAAIFREMNIALDDIDAQVDGGLE